MTRRTSGFTLVELLIALSLFAVIAVAALALMRSSIDTQAALSGRMDRSAGLERVRALIADGLLTAQPQGVRGGGQAPTSAFAGAPDSLSFISAGPGPNDVTALARLTLTARDGQLILRRGEGNSGNPAVLIDNLVVARFRYRGADGGWQNSWAAERPDTLPRAAELTLQQRGGPEILMRFIIAPDWPEPAVVPL